VRVSASAFDRPTYSQTDRQTNKQTEKQQFLSF